MLLHYLYKKENKDRKIANELYLYTISATKLISVKPFINKINNFSLTFEIISLLLFCIFYNESNNKSKKLDLITQEIMNIFIKDLDHSFRVSGVGDMKIGKHVKTYVKKFYFRIAKLEKIFNDNDFEDFVKYCNDFNILNKNPSNNKKIHEFYKDLCALIKRSKSYNKPKNIYVGLFN